MSAESELSGPPNTRFFIIREVEETGSTNADLLREAAQGAPEGLVLLAKHQRSGRGRQGRRWLDSDGSSMLVSWLLRPDRQNLTLLPLLTGLAVADALLNSLGLEVGVKWPNDILARGPREPGSVEAGEYKLAGILAEASSQGRDLAVVVGVGLNLQLGPQNASVGGIDLATLLSMNSDLASLPTAAQLASSVLTEVEVRLRNLETYGPGLLLYQYRERCITLGRLVRMETPAGTIQGHAIDIDDHGALVIETGEGRTTVTAGDAHHIPTIT